MLIEAEIQLCVVLIAHKQPAFSLPLYEYVGVAQGWTKAVSLASDHLPGEVVDPRAFSWHGPDGSRYAVHPLGDEHTRAIHIKEVTV